MSNNWSIPDWLEKKVRLRDQKCVYCKIKMQEHPHVKGTPGDKATFEHIDNTLDPLEDNVAMCCHSCNASKGTKDLIAWFETPYCKKKNINKKTVADIIKKYVEKINRGKDGKVCEN